MTLTMPIMYASECACVCMYVWCDLFVWLYLWSLLCELVIFQNYTSVLFFWDIVSHWTWCLIISKQCWLNCELLAPLFLCSFLSLCSNQCAPFYPFLWKSLGSKFRSLQMHERTLMPGTSPQPIIEIFIWHTSRWFMG